MSKSDTGRRVLGIDPGPERCGVVLYQGGRVLASEKAMDVSRVLRYLKDHPTAHHVGIERVQSYGISGASLLETAEVCGRLHQRSLDLGMITTLHYRREVLRCLDVAGKGNRDSLVRQRLIEMHGGHLKAAKGTKAAPGPLYGVAGHAWQALAVALTALAVLS